MLLFSDMRFSGRWAVHVERSIPEGRVKLSINYVHVHESALTVISRVIHDDVSKMISSSSPRPNVYPHLG
jgi:hypothetical protein